MVIRGAVSCQASGKPLILGNELPICFADTGYSGWAIFVFRHVDSGLRAAHFTKIG